LQDLQAERETAGQTLSDADQARLGELERDLDIGTFESTLRDYEAQPWITETDEARRRRRQTTMSSGVINVFILVLGQPRNERLLGLREPWPPLPRLCAEGTDLLEADPDRAFEVAAQTTLNNRFDLMNARGQAVDAWRQLAVFANALLGVANVEYNLN